jgi:hypothetical protein
MYRLDALRDEVRPARDRCETKVVGDRRQRAEKLLDVRLVSGSLPSEDVRVDHDERASQDPTSR